MLRWSAGAVAIAVAVLVAFVLLAPLGMRPNAAHPPLTQTPADYGLRYDAVTFAPPDRPITLRGWWMPVANARAAVILVHGGGDDNRSQPFQNGLALARDLAARGFGVLAFDLRNYGESDTTPEGVTFGDLEAYDVVGAVDLLARIAPGLPVVGLGCSMGGATLVQAAARDARLRVLVTDSVFADAWDVAPSFVRASSNLPELLVGPVLWSAAHVHGVGLDRGNTIDAARRVTPRPVLLIHNEADPIAAPTESWTLASVMPRSETWITPAPPVDHPLRWQNGRWGTHCQSYKLDPDGYVTQVTAFLTRGLAPPTR